MSAFFSHAVVGLVGLAAGGFGGYKWGRKVEARAAQVLQSIAAKIGPQQPGK